jgi:hypothetical protein
MHINVTELLRIQERQNKNIRVYLRSSVDSIYCLQ